MKTAPFFAHVKSGCAFILTIRSRGLPIQAFPTLLIFPAVGGLILLVKVIFYLILASKMKKIAEQTENKS